MCFFATLQEMRQLRMQTGGVNVDVDSTESVDLTRVLQEVREQYEGVVAKNKQELDKWFQAKVRWEKLNISKIRLKRKKQFTDDTFVCVCK